MPTELEELVEFLHHGNTQIRQIATESLVLYSVSQPDIFKANQLLPIKDLKLLIRDYAPIAKNVITILINISTDVDVLRCLAEDDAFLDSLLPRLFNRKETNADSLAALLANLAKSESMDRIIAMQKDPVADFPVKSKLRVAQLIELYNQGSGWNKDANFDYLGYFFGDLARFPSFNAYLCTPPTSGITESDSTSATLDPLTYFLPLTIHASPIRRRGAVLLLRNVAFVHPDPLYLLQPAHSILPCLLLPLCSSDQSGISEEEMDSLPEECQFLPPSHVQETNLENLLSIIEALYLLAARGGRECWAVMREQGTYVVVRELHLHKENEQLRDWCEKIVDLLKGEEAHAAAAKEASSGGGSGGGGGGGGAVKMIGDGGEKMVEIPRDTEPEQVAAAIGVVEEEDEDDQIIPIA